MPIAAYSYSSKNVFGSASNSMSSRALRRPLPCWFSMFLSPPPSQIANPSLRTCDMRSARKRMLASYRAVVGSTFVVRTLDAWDNWDAWDVCDVCSMGASLRSAMGQEVGLFTVYHSGGDAQRKAKSNGRFILQREKSWIRLLRRPVPSHPSLCFVSHQASGGEASTLTANGWWSLRRKKYVRTLS